MKNRTLREQLEKLIPRGINVKIGSGSQFLYCGKCDENIIETIARISQDYYFKLTDKIQELENYLANFEELWQKRIEERTYQFIKEKTNKPKVSNKINYLIEKFQQEQEEKKNEDFRIYLSQLKNKKEEEKNFTSFLMRKVVKVLAIDPACEPQSTWRDKIIIFEGKERGQYWTIKEYQEGATEDEI